MRKMEVLSFRCKMVVSYPISCKFVSLACDGRWVTFGADFKTNFESNMFFIYWLTNGKNRLIACCVAKVIGVFISQIWTPITGNFLSPFK